MRHTLATIRRIIASFWRPKPQIDYLEAHYELFGEVDRLNEEELGRLMAERDRLKRQKKKWSHVQHSIELMKAKMIMNEMRSK